MSVVRVHRYHDLRALAEGAASTLISEIISLQRTQDDVQLCLSHGVTAERVYEALATSPLLTHVDPTTIGFWWNSENFVPTTDPDRNATKTLATLSRGLYFVPAQTHPMPSKSGNADPDEAAFAYAAELGDTIFDVCMLGLGADGHIAAIYPGHPSFAVQNGTSLTTIGVSDAPTEPRERISLTLNAINRSKQVWFFVSGEQKAEAVAAALDGDDSIPAALARGSERTLWFVDEAAATLLPHYECTF